MVEWLGSGLQNRLCGSNSRSRLQSLRSLMDRQRVSTSPNVCSSHTGEAASVAQDRGSAVSMGTSGDAMPEHLLFKQEDVLIKGGTTRV
jgi:hypothetical protein